MAKKEERLALVAGGQHETKKTSVAMKLILTIKANMKTKERLRTLNALTEGSGAGKLVPQFPNTPLEHPEKGGPQKSLQQLAQKAHLKDIEAQWIRGEKTSITSTIIGKQT